jgi:guanylate kinase
MNTVYVLIGPSGSGKNRLADELQTMGIPRLITDTTREPREGEEHGKDYYFLSEFEFHKRLHVEDTPYDGNNKYGLSVDEFVTKTKTYDKTCVVLDRNGVENLKEKYGDMIKVIYVYTSSNEMFKRMLSRGDSTDKIVKRIQYAYGNGEFNNIDVADYVIVNRDLNQSIKQIKFIVEELSK